MKIVVLIGLLTPLVIAGGASLHYVAQVATCEDGSQVVECQQRAFVILPGGDCFGQPTCGDETDCNVHHVGLNDETVFGFGAAGEAACNEFRNSLVVSKDEVDDVKENCNACSNLIDEMGSDALDRGLSSVCDRAADWAQKTACATSGGFAVICNILVEATGLDDLGSEVCQEAADLLLEKTGAGEAIEDVIGEVAEGVCAPWVCPDIIDGVCQLKEEAVVTLSGDCGQDSGPGQGLPPSSMLNVFVCAVGVTLMTLGVFY